MLLLSVVFIASLRSEKNAAFSDNGLYTPPSVHCKIRLSIGKTQLLEIKDNKKILYNPIIFTLGTTDASNHVVTLMVNKTVLANPHATTCLSSKPEYKVQLA